MERAGFIEAPLTGPPTSAPSATVPPIAGAATCFSARAPVAMDAMTSIRKNVRAASQANDCRLGAGRSGDAQVCVRPQRHAQSEGAGRRPELIRAATYAAVRRHGT